MPSVRAAHHTSFTVANIAPSVSFFRDLLGLELLFEREVHEPYLAQVTGLHGATAKVAVLEAPGGHRVELLQYLAPVGEPSRPRPCDPGSSHLCLTVDDVSAICARLSSAGIEVFSDPVPITAGANRGAFAVYLRDPNGILIELFQPPK